jgi:methylase of polypeptide subunit release factors
MYEYRDYRPRILKKVLRAITNTRRTHDVDTNPSTHIVRKSSIQSLTWPKTFDAIITSPPYMNALDYGRDNRLRLWFLTRTSHQAVDDRNISTRRKFEKAMEIVSRESARGLKKNGFVTIIIGELVDRGRQENTSQLTQEIMKKQTNLRFISQEISPIPDIRRARRNCLAVKDEVFLIYQKQ